MAIAISAEIQSFCILIFIKDSNKFDYVGLSTKGEKKFSPWMSIILSIWETRSRNLKLMPEGWKHVYFGKTWKFYLFFFVTQSPNAWLWEGIHFSATKSAMLAAKEITVQLFTYKISKQEQQTLSVCITGR